MLKCCSADIVCIRAYNSDLHVHVHAMYMYMYMCVVTHCPALTYDAEHELLVVLVEAD